MVFNIETGLVETTKDSLSMARLLNHSTIRKGQKYCDIDLAGEERGDIEIANGSGI